MFCSNCGKELPEDTFFCTKCGMRTSKGAEAGIRTPMEELREAFAKMGQEMEKAFTIAGKEMEKAFKTASEDIKGKNAVATIVCAQCGGKNLADTVFCTKCGKKLS